MIWTALLVSAVGLGLLAARVARERGRSGAAWATLAAVAGVLGYAGGALGLGVVLASSGFESSLSTGAAMWAVVLSIAAPLGSMLAVVLLVSRLPVQVPRVAGTRWTVFRLSSKDAPGADCTIAVEGHELVIGDERIAAVDVDEIAVDRECVRVSWGGRSVHFTPKDEADAPRTGRERERWSAGFAERLRALLAGP